MTILIRADADAAMGSGHVMRCLALAEALIARGRPCHLAAARLPDELAARVREAGLLVHPIDARVDAAATVALGRHLGAEAAIVDGYHFDDAWRRTLAMFGVPVLALWDDAGSAPAGASLVLNPAAAPSANPSLLYGARYVLLRREFSLAAKLAPVPIAERRSIFVSFGGSDPRRLTLPVVTALAAAIPDAPIIDVAVGGAVPEPALLVLALSAVDRRVRAHFNSASMATLMRQAGLAVSAGGSTVGELAAIGVPSIIVTVAANQVAGSHAAAGDGWCSVIDGEEPSLIARVTTLATTLWRDRARRSAQVHRARGTVALDGADQAAERLLSLVRETGRAAAG